MSNSGMSNSGQTSVGLKQTPRCDVLFQGDHLLAVVEHDGHVVDRQEIARIEPERLLSIVSEHRTAFLDGWSPEPYDLWESATTKFLDQVYELVSVQLIEVLASLPRVELNLTDPILARLPIETAHRDGMPALFEVTSVYRRGHRRESQQTGSRESGSGPGGRRTFELDLCLSRLDGLRSVAMEGMLVQSAYRTGTKADPLEGNTERIIHVAGHDPLISDPPLRCHERAHVVLSGCGAASPTLPEGVASATASLWPIDDETNVGTMSLLHSRVAGGIGPLEALRQTQLLQRSLPPVVWASYVHIGQPD